MRSFSVAEVGTIKMMCNPPIEIVNAGMCIIHNKHVKCFVGIGWVVEREATREDYKEIPEVF